MLLALLIMTLFWDIEQLSIMRVGTKN